ncbi:aminoglycoside phosphotransferase family protein [Nitratireductor sp. GCM10026969]|uniref:aminoglycoside phosphotransferase family protein n=1 Tax=Nitratireductor sp. GCM10026969 TaxID=3252645 RepID=UPI003618EE8D
MEIDARIRRTVGDIIAARNGMPPKDLNLERNSRSSFGGAEAAGLAVVTARYRNRLDRPEMRRMVVKRLVGRPAREAAVYERLVAIHVPGMAPELLAVENDGPDSAIIFMEAVRRVNAWPWADASNTAEMLTRLGRFHRSLDKKDVALPEWDYEAELAAMAEATVSALDQCRGHPELGVLTRHMGRLERLQAALPGLRRQLLSEEPFGCRPIHGDLHPGNALVRRRDGTHQPVLIDWGRARVGSPLEDVSSWLQCLRFWDAGAQRVHDRLFHDYLSAFGMPRRLTDDIRAAYWIAGASNTLAGALLYNLSIALDPGQGKARRETAFNVARDWLRIVRRAHAWTM